MDSAWYAIPLEFYKRHLAYRYWHPSLQKMAYRHMDISDWTLLCAIFLIHAALINGGFLALWAIAMFLRKKGVMSETRFRFAAKWLKALISFGCLAAMHFTNNLWVDLAN